MTIQVIFCTHNYLFISALIPHAGIVCAAQDLGSLELVVADPSAVLGLSTDESYRCVFMCMEG